MFYNSSASHEAQSRTRKYQPACRISRRANFGEPTLGCMNRIQCGNGTQKTARQNLPELLPYGEILSHFSGISCRKQLTQETKQAPRTLWLIPQGPNTSSI